MYTNDTIFVGLVIFYLLIFTSSSPARGDASDMLLQPPTDSISGNLSEQVSFLFQTTLGKTEFPPSLLFFAKSRLPHRNSLMSNNNFVDACHVPDRVLLKLQLYLTSKTPNHSFRLLFMQCLSCICLVRSSMSDMKISNCVSLYKYLQCLYSHSAIP